MNIVKNDIIKFYSFSKIAVCIYVLRAEDDIFLSVTSNVSIPIKFINPITDDAAANIKVVLSIAEKNPGNDFGS